MFQISELRLGSLFFQVFHPMVIANGFEQELDRHVYPDDQDDDQEVRCYKRRQPETTRIGLAVRVEPMAGHLGIGPKPFFRDHRRPLFQRLFPVVVPPWRTIAEHVLGRHVFDADDDRQPYRANCEQQVQPRFLTDQQEWEQDVIID